MFQPTAANWTRFAKIAAPSYAPEDLRKRAEDLEARRAAIAADQVKIDAHIAALQDNAVESLNVAQDAELAGLNVVELLKREIALRIDLADLLGAIREDAKTHAEQANADLNAAIQAAHDALIAAGWTEKDVKDRAFIVYNDRVRNARLKLDDLRLRASDYESVRANQAAIDGIKATLNQMAVRSLKAAGV